MRWVVSAVGAVAVVASVAALTFGVAGSRSASPIEMLVFAGQKHSQSTDHGDLFLVPPAGGTLRRLTSNGADMNSASDDDPSWSPDGKWIAFSRLWPLVNGGELVRDLEADLMVIDASGGQERSITGGSNYYWIDTSPSWSPDGRRIAFSREDAFGRTKNGVYGIYVVGADGKGLRRIAKRAAVAVDWSPDGSSLAFVTGFWSTGASGRVGTIGLATGATRTFALAGAQDVAWAPDGRMLAVAGDRGISILTPSGRKLRQIEAPAASVTWSPDGRWLAYGATTRDGRYGHIHIASANGRGTRQVTSKSIAYDLDWRP